MSSEPFIERHYEQQLLSMQESAQPYCLVCTCITIRDFVLKLIFCSKINLLLARNDHLKAHLDHFKCPWFFLKIVCIEEKNPAVILVIC